MPTKRHPNAKPLRLICTEEQAKAIVLPLVNFTAYCLSIESTEEMPDIKSMMMAILPSKEKLAVLMATKLGKPILAKDLSGIDVTAVTHAGYFKLTVTHKSGEVGQQYNITMIDRLDLSMIFKTIQNLEHNNPKLSVDEVTKLAWNKLKEL